MVEVPDKMPDGSWIDICFSGLGRRVRVIFVLLFENVYQIIGKTA
jgi:hypothetical protein